MSVLRIVSALFLVPFFLGGGSLRAAERVGQGIVVLYEFEEGKGDTVHDRSGVGTPVDLKIETPKAVTWKDGAIEIHGSALIVSPQSAAKVSDAVKRSNEITIEAWLKPAALNQSGPARIVSLSRDPNARNFTLGQDNDFYDVRFRTPNTDANGNPSTSSPKKSLETRLTHVIYTRDGRGMATVYLDGKQVASKSVSGNLKNWDSNFRLSLGNEVTKDRPWKGEFHLVAIYERALSPQQVQQNFQAGPGAETASNREMSVADAKARHFQKDVAPILAKHCLECHDSAIKKGDLDLSVKTAAFQGGESGKAIVPGKVSDSPLWEYVASNDMPKDRAPLSDQEKDVLKKWIADGAVWEPEVIDPANYRHSAESGQVWIQRLTIPEYIATVRAATGVDISKEANDLLPKDLRADGFSNTAYNLGVDLKHVEAYGQLASIIVDRMDIRKFAGRFSKSKKLSTDDTMRDHVAAMGKWLLRGPLDQRDINVYSGIATTVASAGGDFEEANRYMIEAMLQSPRFL
ncbi:MAG: DUF1587 domain-containing protein, partial [Planctomycetaceae bacterium]|nr:DUF1587 domain-containing protein [Planctomycetaceae bacterium]